MVSSLWKACQDGDSARVDELLADSSQDFEIKDHNGVTPLILAVKGGHATIIQALLNRGADPNNASAQGRPETYTTDPYILHLLAVARGEIAPYPEPQIHPQYYAYPPYYPYVQDPWYLAHHQQQTPQQEDHQPDPADSTSNTATATTNPSSGNPSTISVNQPSHPSLPPPEIARNIPCRYFPACRYGSSCVFLHPTTPYFPGPLPPPAQYPHMYYQPLSYPLQGTATSTAAAAGTPVTAAPVDSNEDHHHHHHHHHHHQASSAQPSSSSAATPSMENGVVVSSESATPPAQPAGPGSESGAHDHASKSPASSPTSYAHPGMYYMYPASMHPPHSQDGAPPPPPPPVHHYYPPPPPGAAHPHPPQPQSTMPLPPPPPHHQHILPPPQAENAVDQQPILDTQGQPQPQPQQSQQQQAHPPHVMPYPPPPHIYPPPIHPSWTHIPPPPPPPPPPHHHQPQLHSGVHPHHHMHPGASIPPPHPALATAMPVHSMPGIPGAIMPVPPGPGGIPPPPGGSGGSFVRGGGGGAGRGGRRGSAAFRGDRDREGRDRADRERDRERGDRFGAGVNGHYHGSGAHHSRKPPCMFFPNGKCRNGDGCRFSHVLPDTSTVGAGLNGTSSSLPSSHRHSQSLSYRRSNYVNGHASNAHVSNGIDGEAGGSAAGAGTGAGSNAVVVNAGMAPSSIDTVDEILNAMTLDSVDGPGGAGRRQLGGRRGKHHAQGSGGGGGYAHHHNGFGGHAVHRSLSASPSRGHYQQQQQQQQQQRVPTADDFPVLGGISTNGAGSSTATSATGRTTPIHPISSGASNAGGGAGVTNSGASSVNASAGGGATSPGAVTTTTSTAHPVSTNGWSTPLVNGGAVRPTAAQVVKEGMANGHGHGHTHGHGHVGAWGKPPPVSSSSSSSSALHVEKEKEKETKLKDKEKEKEKESERAVREVKVTA